MVKSKDKNNNRFKSTLYIVLGVVALLSINIIANYTFHRWDLTEDHHFSISQSSIDIVEGLDDILYIKVYLDGDLPAGFKQLKKSTKELLDEFRAYNHNIQYEFINPSEKEDKQERFKVYKQLAQDGLAYYNIPVENKDGFAQKTIFPSAQINYKGKTIPLNLLVSNRTTPTDADLNNSVQKLELNIITAVNLIASKKIKTIAFSSGHGELSPLETADIGYELLKSYDVQNVEIKGKINALNTRMGIDSTHTKISNRFDLVIIAKPDSAFNDADKFIIDQYIMHGGKVIWLIDAIQASMDSLMNSTTTIGMPLDLNLSDLFFKYGFRIKPNLVLNRNAVEIGTKEGVLRPWDFFPLGFAPKGHIISENVEAIKTQFVNALEPIKKEGIKYTPLVTTDLDNRIMPAPAIIDVADIIYRKPNLALYQYPPQLFGLLLEGEFTSGFEDKIIDPRIANNKDFDIRQKSPSSSMAVFSDGDLIRNQIIQQNSGPFPLPLGYDRYSKKMFDNKKLLLNTINYMLGDINLIKLRNKEFKIRLLDKTKIANERLKWQLINIFVPLALILILGFVLGIWKRIKYSK